MARRSSILSLTTKASVMLVLMFSVFLGDISSAYAQAQNCSQLNTMIRSIERNRAYQNYQANAGNLRNLENQVRGAESIWVRNGCQQANNAGQSISRECRSVAQTITSGRNAISRLAGQVVEGQQLAAQREQMYQNYARFSCGTNASNAQPARQSLLDQIFGTNQPVQDGNVYTQEPLNQWSSSGTKRTVCVRTCDGFFWPISYSTTDDFVNRDSISCHEMCPGTEALLFSYNNPGGEPEDMVSATGVPYRSQPYAFKFRETYDASCSCNAQQQPENMSVATGFVVIGHTSGTANFDDINMPLPQTDPRGYAALAASIETANLVDIALPRIDTRNEKSANATVVKPDNDLRIVEIGNKKVRVVGPQTPYVPTTAVEF